MQTKYLKRITAFGLSMLMGLSSFSVYAANSFDAGDSFKIKYTHNSKVYTKKAVDARWDNKILGTKMPGYIDEDDNAMYSAYWIFGQSEGPKTLYKYTSNYFTLTRGSTTIKMTVNNKTAYINGKKVLMETAPRKVYNYKNDTNYIMVPGNWTAKKLGLLYTWNSSKRAGLMKNKADATTATPKPTTTATTKPTTTTTTATTKPTTPTIINNKVTTAYNQTLSDYAKLQLSETPKYGSTTLTADTYKKALAVSNTIGDYQFLRLNAYHNVNESAYASKVNSLVSSKTNSVLKDKGSSLISAAKAKKIDPIYFLAQTINESAYGTSDLSKKTITKIVSGDSLVKDSAGNITGFKQVNGKYITKDITSTTVYNLYGIKAYDSDPQLCGSSYAYYMGWTTVDKAINGAAAYVSDNYIHHATYNQNTLYKIRFNPIKDNVWHQYSTNPTYATELGATMNSLKSLYDGCANTFTYDFPSFKTETTTSSTSTSASTSTPTTQATPTYTTTGPLPNSRVKASSSNYDFRIKLPSGVTKYYREDKYTSRQLFISCAGNYTSHFSSSSNRYAKSSSPGYTVKYNTTKKRTYIYIKPSSSYRGYSVTFSKGYAYIKWGTPKTMYKNIVVLDAGHGGTDSGAVGNGLKEKDLTLNIVLAAKAKFDANKNYAVYYTRTTDTYPSLSARSALANAVDADYFISCHINSAGSTAKGTETLYNSSGYKASNGVTSYKLATNTHSYIRSATGFSNRGLVNRTGLAVLRHTETASTLTEFGFISNKTEAASMKKNTTAYGNAVYNSIVKMFNSYPSKR